MCVCVGGSCQNVTQQTGGISLSHYIEGWRDEMVISAFSSFNKFF